MSTSSGRREQGSLSQPLQIQGLVEFQKALKNLDGESQKLLRVVLNDVAQIIVNVAKPRVPRKTGAAAASIRAMSSQRESRVAAGGKKAPYFPWLDYGGRVGRGRVGQNSGSVHRDFIKTGRYIFPAYEQERANVQKLAEKRLAELATSTGLAVSSDGE